MNSDVLTAIGVVAVFAALAYAAVRLRGAKRPPVVQASAPIIPMYQAAPLPDLIDLHIAHQDRREREIRRQIAERKLDQAVLYEDTLKKIAEVMKPPEAAAAPVTPPPAPPNP